MYFVILVGLMSSVDSGLHAFAVFVCVLVVWLSCFAFGFVFGFDLVGCVLVVLGCMFMGVCVRLCALYVVFGFGLFVCINLI